MAPTRYLSNPVFVVHVGNVLTALEMTDELLTLVPNHNRAIGNRVYYLQDIAQKGLSKRKGEDGQEDSAVNAQVSRELVLILKDILLSCLSELNFHFFIYCAASHSQ